MYDLSIFDKNNVHITWSDVYYGIKKNLLELACVSEYAIRCIGKADDDCQEIMDLAWKNEDKLDLLENMAKIIKKENKSDDYQSKIKWQYCIVKKLRDSQMKFEDLSDYLDEVYADFDYPEEMEEFVSYMPIKDGYNPSTHTKEENIERRLRRVDEFLDSKENEIVGFKQRK